VIHDLSNVAIFDYIEWPLRSLSSLFKLQTLVMLCRRWKDLNLHRTCSTSEHRVVPRTKQAVEWSAHDNLLLARLMGQYCFARCRLSFVVCNAAGVRAGRSPGAWAVGRPTLHGGPVRLRPVKATPCFIPTRSLEKLNC